MGPSGAAGLHSTKRVSPLIYILVTNNYATYKELKYDYDIWEALDMFEMCMVSAYNKTEVAEYNKDRLNRNANI